MTDSKWELRYNRKSRTGRDRWEVIFDLNFLNSIIEKLERMKISTCPDIVINIGSRNKQIDEIINLLQSGESE